MLKFILDGNGCFVKKRWSLTICFGIVFILIFPIIGLSQYVETVRAFVYDRGLLSAAEPFAPTGNPALLSLKNDVRLNLEYYRTNVDNYSLSLLCPLSSASGLGIFYSSRYDDEMHNLSFGAFEVVQKKQTFLVSLGHYYVFRFGQQIEFDFELRRYSTIYMTENSDVPFSNDQLFVCSYRLGHYQQFWDNFTLGFLTPPILPYQYRCYSLSEISPRTAWFFWHETTAQTKVPLVAIEWKVLPDLGFLLSKRSKSGKENLQLAVEWS